MTIGEKVKFLRERCGMSQEELAHACGLKGRSSVSRIEKDDGGVPLKRIEKLAIALNTTPGYLAGWYDDLPNGGVFR